MFANFETQTVKIVKDRQISFFKKLCSDQIRPKIIQNTYITQIFLEKTDLENKQLFILAKNRNKNFNIIQTNIFRH